MPESKRLFFAIELPTTIQRQIVRWRADCFPPEAGRPVAAANLHLTLAFLGEVDAASLPDLDAGLSAIAMPPIALSAKGIGHFASKGRPHALWAGAEPAEQLARCLA